MTEAKTLLRTAGFLRRICFLSLSAVVFFTSSFSSSSAADMEYFGSGGHFSLPVRSLSDQRFFSVTKQQYDFSCGSAALATLLTYHYERPHSEKEALDAMYKVGDKEKIVREGFSLLDMKKYLETLGLRADGYKQSLDNLSNVGIPAIVLINYHGYLHFVVLKGVSSQYVLLGDPSLGLRTVRRDQFEAMWNGILFVIRDDIKTAKNHFNLITDWASVGKAPTTTTLHADRGLGSFTLEVATTPNYY